MNKFDFFKPLMKEYECRFIEKYLNENDVLLEWGCGNSTIYFSGIVKKVISIEHDESWYNKIKDIIKIFNIENIEIVYVPPHFLNPYPNPYLPSSYSQFKDYIEYPRKHNLKFTKVFIDGRARLHCARSIVDMIDETCTVILHDFNRSEYHPVLQHYDLIERIFDDTGIVSLKKSVTPTVEEQLKPIEETIYPNLQQPLLYYDIGELGWSRYLSAHVNYLTKNGVRVSISVNKQREVLYYGMVENILPIPESFRTLYENTVSASFHRHNPKTGVDIKDHNVLSIPFKDSYSGYTVMTDYSKFEGERIFEKYHHSKDCEKFCERFRKCIIVLPRHRKSRFLVRNIPENKWIEYIETLCKKFPKLDIISIGGKNETLNVDLELKNYYNLVENENNLEILITLCNTEKVVTMFGTQSGISHVGTLCGAPSFIIGHDTGFQGMGLYTENWTRSEIYFHETRESENGYDLSNFDIKQVIDFIKKNLDGHNYK